ncbi:hypothetical protein E2562_032356 [Oryza meyeriana var. granulata]|uniref:Uncharacterized protein n=1 Tax=Oryza meyeriana var. granulata TaxID=110450 RepID=A0A6G1E688_9ORYZ|nr:hypothetical protein E2562_032356 [Oryza meyeriana var. granulata]
MATATWKQSRAAARCAGEDQAKAAVQQGDRKVAAMSGSDGVAQRGNGDGGVGTDGGATATGGGGRRGAAKGSLPIRETPEEKGRKAMGGGLDAHRW